MLINCRSRKKRIKTGRIASCHFAPTSLSKQNLLNEGVSEEKIAITGNTVIDALHIVAVSYTHLDVYKRQPISICQLMIGIRKL